jgi:hypothetical protein
MGRGVDKARPALAWSKKIYILGVRAKLKFLGINLGQKDVLFKTKIFQCNT